MDKITLSSAIVGYTIAAQARRLSEHTIADYANTFRKLQRHVASDTLIASIAAADILTHQLLGCGVRDCPDGRSLRRFCWCVSVAKIWLGQGSEALLRDVLVGRGRSRNLRIPA